MPYTLNEIKLLSFVVLFKSKRRNSMFHLNEKHHTLAIELGISKNTVKKYINELRSLGLISLINGREAIVKLSDCIRVLMGKEDKDFSSFKYVRFMRGVEYPSITFKAIYEQIQVAIVKQNIDQQNFYNDKIKEAKELLLKSRITARELKSIKAAAKKLGSKNDTSILKSINDNDYSAKTGRKHLSRLIGCSPTTGQHRLKEWAKKHIINRTIVRKDLNVVANNATFDLLKDKYSHLLISNGMYYTVLGSTISFNVW